MFKIFKIQEIVKIQNTQAWSSAAIAGFEQSILSMAVLLLGQQRKQAPGQVCFCTCAEVPHT